MSTQKKRVTWEVRLYDTSFSGKEETYPRPVIRGTADIDRLAQRAQEISRGSYQAEELKLVMSFLTQAARDLLVDGYSVETPIGKLTPTVTGAWNPNRTDPKVRAQNKATVAFTLGPLLKEAFENPLFHEDKFFYRQGPYVYSILDMESQEVNTRLTPGGYVILRGRHLLMNGDLPERGVELLHADTDEVVCRYEAADVLRQWNTRTRIQLRLPADLAPGRYRFAIATQCTTGPKPLKRVNRTVDNVELEVGGAESGDSAESGDGA